jgi:superfamily II DNA/RNA helicase
MVVNYDLPMIGGNGDQPDIETYIHRIGKNTIVAVGHVYR